MNEAFSTQWFCEWRRRENRWQIVFTVLFLLENLSWACYFASVYAAMSLLKLSRSGDKPKVWVCWNEWLYVVDLQNKKKSLFIYCILKQNIRL